MDPMDFTMDGGQGNPQRQQSGDAHQYQCHVSSAFPSRLNMENQSSRAIPIRESQPYDPVHDNSGPNWYHGTSGNSNNVPTQTSYPQAETTFGASFSTYQASYSPYEFSTPGQPPLYRYMGGHEGIGGSSWMDRGGQPPSQLPYTPSPYYYYQTPTMSTGSDINVQNTTTSHPSALPTPNHHAMAQRRAWQAARADHESIRNRVNSQLRAVPGNTDRTFEQPTPSILAAGGSYQPTNRPGHSLDQAQVQAGARIEAARARQARAARPHSYRSSDDDDDEGASGFSPGERFRRRSDFILASEEDEERVMAVMRGAIAASGKSVPTKEALASLINMTIDEVKAEGEDTNCIICYNDFGTPNPEGIIEFPIKLPKCKHIFGSVCIKKWFEDADSCPYCRDKLPSEASNRKTAMLEQYRILRERERERSEPSRLAIARARYEATFAYHRSSEIPSSSSNRENERMQRDFESAFTPSRVSATDSAERRRPNRGRASGRPNQPSFTRAAPTVGSFRPALSQRTVLNTAPPSTPVVTTHRTLLAGPGFTSLSATSTTIASSHTTRRGAISEEASPAVAVGSFVPPGNRLPEQFQHGEIGSGLRAHNDNLSHLRGSPTVGSSAHFEQEISSTPSFSASVGSRVPARATHHSRNMPYDPTAPSVDSSPPEQERNFGNGGSPMSSTFRPRWTR